MTAYDAAFEAQYPREFLTLILRIVEEYQRNFGKFPTPTELKALLMRPS